jgi:hypothetical protein
MKFKVNKRKRVKINLIKLWDIKNENYGGELWLGGFIKIFTEECGLVKTSNRTTRYRDWLGGITTVNEIYYFKIVDEKKYFLGKIKYGF